MASPRPASLALRLGLPLLAALLLVACARTTVVREEPPRRGTAEAGTRPAASAAGTLGATHRVQAGDTLYGIAFRNGLDWRDVARWNDLSDPDVIQVGQTLRLSPPGAVAARPAARPATRPSPAGQGASSTMTQGVVGRTAAGPPPMPRGPAGASPPSAAVSPPAAATPIAAATPAGPAGATAFRPGQWQWPTRGQVVSRFAEGDKSRQGIAIAGTAGQPVRAAAAGTVVYSGAGLVGYGELIIIKHSEEWLSAYGHNRRRLVAEGANVAVGQQIAELGRTGTSRDMLHFEIRRNGRPLDPMPLLPKP